MSKRLMEQEEAEDEKSINQEMAIHQLEWKRKGREG
jgi:hypothetical protein